MMSNVMFKDLSHGITLIDAEYGQSGVAAMYLMQENGKVAIIETGTNHSVSLIKTVLESKNRSFDDVSFVIPTHVHLDHAGGAGELMRQCKNAKLVIHPYGARHMVDPSKLEAGTIAVYGEENFRKLYGKIIPIDVNRIIEAPDNFKINLNGRKLKFLNTPGHAKHHFCVYDKKSKGIFTGDTFGLSYPQLETAQGPFIFATTTPVQFDPGALLQSIERLISLKPNKMYLTHFGEITPTPEIVEQLKDSICAFSNIALSYENEDNQLEKIQKDITTYLLDRLKEAGCKQTTEFCQEVITMDTLLNAQGLSFWLTKL